MKPQKVFLRSDHFPEAPITSPQLTQGNATTSMAATLTYLVLAFPLGIVYFVFLITGLTLGIGLSIIGVGIPILIFMLASVRKIAAFERTMATKWLGMPLTVASQSPLPGWIERIKHDLRDTGLWTALAYLLLKMPLGVVSFTLVIGLSAIAFGFIVMPIAYWFSTIYHFSIMGGFFEVDSWSRAFMCSLIGVGIAMATVACFRGLGNLWIYLTKTMLQPSS